MERNQNQISSKNEIKNWFPFQNYSVTSFEISKFQDMSKVQIQKDFLRLDQPAPNALIDFIIWDPERIEAMIKQQPEE